MKEINSNSNKNYKLCIQLSLKKYRDRYGLYLVEGDNLVAEALKHGVEIESIFISEDYSDPDGLHYLKPYILSNKLFNNISQTETSRGIAAVVRKREYGIDEFFECCGDGNVIVLDRLQDPGNIGTVIRTAEAAGYKGAVILKGTGDVYSPKVVRAAAGSLFRLPVLFLDTPDEALGIVRAHGKKIVCACPDALTFYYDVDLSSNTALIIGNEGNGICSRFIEGSDAVVTIPMDKNVDSLNAAVAAGIIMFAKR